MNRMLLERNSKTCQFQKSFPIQKGSFFLLRKSSKTFSESLFSENKVSTSQAASCGRITKRKVQNSSNILCALEYRSQAKIFTGKENSATVRRKSAALDFHSQFSRFDKEDLLRWNLHALLEYPRTDSLFDFTTLSPDGTVLEAQKKAFTRS